MGPTIRKVRKIAGGFNPPITHRGLDDMCVCAPAHCICRRLKTRKCALLLPELWGGGDSSLQACSCYFGCLDGWIDGIVAPLFDSSRPPQPQLFFLLFLFPRTRRIKVFLKPSLVQSCNIITFFSPFGIVTSGSRARHHFKRQNLNFFFLAPDLLLPYVP